MARVVEIAMRPGRKAQWATNIAASLMLSIFWGILCAIVFLLIRRGK